MKIEINFKTPDAVYDAIERSFSNTFPLHMTPLDKRATIDHYKNKLDKWIEYGESVTLVYDTLRPIP
jgi:hypothetical protein